MQGRLDSTMRALLHGSESTAAQQADGLQVLPDRCHGHENQIKTNIVARGSRSKFVGKCWE